MLNQRGAVDRRLMVGGGVVVGVIALFLLSRSGRPTPQSSRSATPLPATQVPSPTAPDDVPAVSVDATAAVDAPADPPADASASADAEAVMAYDGVVAIGVRAAIPGMVSCFQEGGAPIRRNTYVWFTIDRSGHVVASHLSVDAGASLNACVLATLQRLSFPSPGQNSRELGIPLPVR